MGIMVIYWLWEFCYRLGLEELLLALNGDSKHLGVYMVMHAALFVNFQEINPKLLVLILQIIMLFTLYYLMPPVKLLETEQSDS